MLNKEKSFGPFGSGSRGTVGERKKRRFQRGLTFSLLFILGMLIPAAYVGWSEVYVNFLEKDPPQLHIPKAPVGLGADPLSFAIEVSDEGSGLDEVVVRSSQGGEVREILKRRYARDPPPSC